MLKHIITNCQKRGANSKCYKSSKTNINSLELEKDIMGELSKNIYTKNKVIYTKIKSNLIRFPALLFFFYKT